MEISCAGADPTEQDLLQQGSEAQLIYPLSMSLVEAALGPPGMYRPRPTTTCVLARANQQELQSDLQIIATCAELGGTHGRQAKASCC